MSAQIRAESVLKPSQIKILNGKPRMRDYDLAKALGFANKYNIRKIIRQHSAAIEAIAELVFSAAEKTPKGGRPGKEYWLTKKQCLYICTKSETPNATEITIRMVEVFDEVTEGRPSLAAGNPYYSDGERFNKVAHWQAKLQEAQTHLSALGIEPDAPMEVHHIQTVSTELFKLKEDIDRVAHRIRGNGVLNIAAQYLPKQKPVGAPQ